MKVKMGLVDDHRLFLRSLGLMLASFQHYEVVMEASNGQDLQEKMASQKILPEIMLIDVNMPIMNGIQTATWLAKDYPAIKLVALSMKDDDTTIIEMLKAGCCAYMLKDAHPDELEKALDEVDKKGFYNGDAGNINYRRLLMVKNEDITVNISEREKMFLQFACSDMTYKHIASVMGLSERTIDGYREAMFEKLNVRSRVGLAMEAIRRNLVQL